MSESENNVETVNAKTPGGASRTTILLSVLMLVAAIAVIFGDEIKGLFKSDGGSENAPENPKGAQGSPATSMPAQTPTAQEVSNPADSEGAATADSAQGAGADDEGPTRSESAAEIPSETDVRRIEQELIRAIEESYSPGGQQNPPAQSLPAPGGLRPTGVMGVPDRVVGPFRVNGVFPSSIPARSTADITDLGTNKAFAIEVDQVLGDYRVTAISFDGVKMVKNDEELFFPFPPE
ncbi:MAG: hypothetical protein NUW37_15715 [Planctomycetes bacterium]|nr:hypothetical protein [Planctomycetota bacterium]